MDLDRPLPGPITPEARPFWDGLREQKLMLPKCGACGHVFFYPRVLCPRCHAGDIGRIQASGRGTLHAFEIGYQAFSKAWKVKPPWVLAMVELAEGLRPPDPTVIRCDMPVRVVFTKLTDEITLPLFEPAR
ncbi:MAG: OB-fold domain-containing protein [Candidatus Rokubacteria bacterium]|nr:OB-fold domain-containing protein [Candidatus Rokubacteria bacterium]MBI4254686.1 OB-fold domain-containing protein [Candidatus Rokubacteria bacterium]